MLEAHYGLYATLDPRLEKATERLLDDFVYQPRTPRLRRDLIALGADAGDIESLPTLEPDTVPAWAERTRLLGALYVVEGSELGGLVIRRELDEVLDDEAREADAFYQSERQHVGERWNAFRALFDTHVDEGEAFERAVEGAHEMFQLYEDWFG